MVASKTSRSVALASPSRQRMVPLLRALAQGEGFSQSRLPGVKFMRSTIYLPPSPITYDPSIVIVGQGRKAGRLGEKTFRYDANNYLVLAMHLPFECETFGSPEEPVLGMSVGVTAALVAELLMQMETGAAGLSAHPQAIDAAPLDDALENTAVRLLEALQSPDEARILGPQLVRELTYRVLRGPLGANLRALAAPHSHFGQISRVLNRIHTEFAQSFDMETLAREAGMSVSTFHSHFKAMTSSSPLQYLKTIRLHKARMLMVHDGATAASAALRVGYESASQFSREFKRHFGDAPAAVAAALRQHMVRLT